MCSDSSRTAAGVLQMGQTTLPASDTPGPRYPQIQEMGATMQGFYQAARCCEAGFFVAVPCSTCTIESARARVLARCVIMITVRFTT